MIDDDPPMCVAAAYETRKVAPNTYKGEHVGIFDSEDDAKAWLKTGSPYPTKLSFKKAR